MVSLENPTNILLLCGGLDKSIAGGHMFGKIKINI